MRRHNSIFSKNGFARKTTQAQQYFRETDLQKKKTAQAQNGIFSKNGFAKNGAGTTVLSQKKTLAEKNGAGRTVFCQKTVLQKSKQKTAQAQQYFLGKQFCK